MVLPIYLLLNLSLTQTITLPDLAIRFARRLSFECCR